MNTLEHEELGVIGTKSEQARELGCFQMIVGASHIKLSLLNCGRNLDFLLSIMESCCFNLGSMNLYRKKVTTL